MKDFAVGFFEVFDVLNKRTHVAGGGVEDAFIIQHNAHMPFEIYNVVAL